MPVDTVSSEAVELVASFEGFRSEAYDDGTGTITIGYGTTRYENGQAVQKGDTITKAKAKELLKKQLQQHANTIYDYVKVSLNQSQFDALASFQYNLGKHILKGSQLLKYINNREWTKVSGEMKKYNKATVNGRKVVLNGLIKRREAEAELFLKDSFEIRQIVVDGNWGEETTLRLQEYFGTTEDSFISGQPKNNNTKRLYSVRYGKGGSELIGAMQRYFGSQPDKVISYPSNLIKAIQKRFNMQQTGLITKELVRKIQNALNKGSL